jgi:hypothetical protein
VLNENKTFRNMPILTSFTDISYSFWCNFIINEITEFKKMFHIYEFSYFRITLYYTRKSIDRIHREMLDEFYLRNELLV